VVKLNGSEYFDIYLGTNDYSLDHIIIYDGYESEKNVINFLSGSLNSNNTNQQSTGEIMEIVFKRFAKYLFQNLKGI
jgi:hypothetical protein